jgi:hypothetical protein
MENLDQMPEVGTPEVPETPAAPQERVSDRFSFLAKKEAGIVRQRQELKSQMDAIAAQKTEMDKLRQEIDQARQRKGSYKANPLAVLEDHGLSYKELTDYILNNNTVSTESQIKALQDKIEQQEKQRELDRQEQVKREQERHAARETEVIAEFKSEIGTFLSRQSEKYELTNLYDSADLVYDTVEEYFAKTNKVLSIPEACDLVESYLEKQVEKSLATKKLSARVSKQEPSSPTANKPSEPRRTLTNNDYTSSTPSFVSPKVENDRMSRALAALDQ